MTNQRKCRCFHCHADLLPGSGIAFDHTTGTRYFCSRCVDFVGSYSWENGATVSAKTAQGFTISKEFEIPRSAVRFFDPAAALAKLTSYGWIATQDSTVWRECKTPIYQSLQSYNKISRAVEKALNVSSWRCDPSYGTHTNVGHPDLDIDIVRKWRESIFGKLQATMDENPETMVSLYGRGWTYYAGKMNEYAPGWQEDHGCFINLQHNTHVEFRLNKFQSAEQDGKVNAYCIETVGALVELCKAIKANRERLHGAELIAENKKAVEKTAAKVDNIYRKHTGLPRINKTAKRERATA